MSELEERLKKEYKVNVISMSYDLSIVSNVYKLVESLVTQNINISILINNAGLGKSCKFHEMDIKTIESILNVNCLSATILTRLLLPKMVQQGHGRIMNISSVAAYSPAGEEQIYHASKAYMSFFSQGIQYEL